MTELESSALVERPEGPKQFSPRQNAVPPLVNEMQSTNALKGLNSYCLVNATHVLPLQGICARVVSLPRAALCYALGFDVYARWAMLLGNAVGQCCSRLPERPKLGCVGKFIRWHY